MGEQVFYQIEFHVPGFVEAFVLLPGERDRRKFTEYHGSTMVEQETNACAAIEIQYPGAIRLYEDEMRDEKKRRGRD